jgi:hypothetical protein
MVTEEPYRLSLTYGYQKKLSEGGLMAWPPHNN